MGMGFTSEPLNCCCLGKKNGQEGIDASIYKVLYGNQLAIAQEKLSLLLLLLVSLLVRYKETATAGVNC